MKKRKMICLALCVILALTALTGCGKQPDINAYWGKSPEETLAGLGLDAAKAQIYTNDFLHRDDLCYEFEEIEFLGEMGKLTLTFTGWEGHDPLFSSFQCIYPTEQARKKAKQRLTEMEGYTVIKDTPGFYDNSRISEEERLWLSVNTGLLVGEEGIGTAYITGMRGSRVKKHSMMNEIPLVTVGSWGGEGYYYLVLSDQYFHIMEQKEAFEQIVNTEDGFTLSDELKQELGL